MSLQVTGTAGRTRAGPPICRQASVGRHAVLAAPEQPFCFAGVPILTTGSSVQPRQRGSRGGVGRAARTAPGEDRTTDRYHVLRTAVPERWVMAGTGASIPALRACCGQGFVHCPGCRWPVPRICHTRLVLCQTPATRLWPRSPALLGRPSAVRQPPRYFAARRSFGSTGPWPAAARMVSVTTASMMWSGASAWPWSRRVTRGAGKNGARNRLWPSGLLNACKGVIVTITDRMAA